MGVDLGGADVGVTEEGLDGADIGTIHEEIGGEGMAEGVRGDVLGDAGLPRVFFDHALDGSRREAAVVARGVDGALVFAVVEKEGVKGIVADGEIISDGTSGGLGDEDGAVFVSLATNDELAAVEVDRVAIEPDKLGDTEATGKEKLDNGAISESGLGI